MEGKLNAVNLLIVGGFKEKTDEIFTLFILLSNKQLPLPTHPALTGIQAQTLLWTVSIHILSFS